MDDKRQRLNDNAAEMFGLLKLALGDTEYVLSVGFWAEVRAVVAKVEGSTLPSAQRHSEEP